MELRVNTWFERDRAHVRLFDNETDETILEFWDNDVQGAVDDGFLDPSDWENSMIEYAIHLGLIEEIDDTEDEAENGDDDENDDDELGEEVEQED